MHEAMLKCSEGWTSWVNQDKHVPSKGRKGQPSDTEPLPTALILNNLPGAKCREDQMIDIECRTVDTHQDPKSTGLDVECSLEHGLVCTSDRRDVFDLRVKGKETLCPDFEIRVLCQCEEATTELPMGPCDPATPNREHPTDCHLFYHCVPGMMGAELVEKTCGEDMMYNPETQVTFKFVTRHLNSCFGLVSR